MQGAFLSFTYICSLKILTSTQTRDRLIKMVRVQIQIAPETCLWGLDTRDTAMIFIFISGRVRLISRRDTRTPASVSSATSLSPTHHYARPPASGFRERASRIDRVKTEKMAKKEKGKKGGKRHILRGFKESLIMGDLRVRFDTLVDIVTNS
jgi:hypothetical protein